LNHERHGEVRKREKAGSEDAAAAEDGGPRTGGEENRESLAETWM
jgi:hypothetical protein